MKPARSAAKSTSSIITTNRNSTSDGADIDDDQDHRQELGAKQHEQACGIEEGEDQEQHRMHGVARGDHHEGRAEHDGSEQIEEQRTQHMVFIAS